VEEHSDTQCAFFGESMFSPKAVEPATIVAHGDVVVLCLQSAFLNTIEQWQRDEQAPVVYDIGAGDLTEIGLLGRGSYGTVSMVRVDAKGKSEDGTILALKQFSKAAVWDQGSFDALLLEKEIMLDIKPHPFVLQLHATFQDRDHLYMLTELCQGGELYSLIHHDGKSGGDGGGVSEEWARFYAANVFLALEHLHEQDWIYRDLKPENIMLDSNGYVKLIDMGFAKKLPYTDTNDDGSSTTHTRAFTVCGTPYYFAPEFIMQTGYNAAVDYWSLGVLVFEMLVGYTPFRANDMVNVFKKIVVIRAQDKAVQLPEEFSEFSPDVADLISKLLTGNPAKRLGMLANGTLDIRTHSWFDKYNFDEILSKTMKPPYAPTLESATDRAMFKSMEPTPFDKFELPHDVEDPFEGF
jgi:cGMP-dependent protein kinase